MKFIHLSDLHLGKKLNEFSMLEDQRYILDQILRIIEEQNADAVMIAGDIYDKPVPPGSAVKLFDSFITSIAEMGIKAFIISGNHDSAERLSFGSNIMKSEGIYFSQVYEGHTEPIILNDEYGRVSVYLLPFLKPAQVRQFFPDIPVETYEDAVLAAVSEAHVNESMRSIIVSHQFVTGAVTSDSEERSVGGLDNISAAVYEKFDYAALGHIHKPQSLSGGRVRYCGTPLKYSFSEAEHKKTVTVVDMKEKGNTDITEIPLSPLHDLRIIRGTYMELTASSAYTEGNKEDYIRAVLTDENEINCAIGKLRAVYPNIMQVMYDNTRTNTLFHVSETRSDESKSPLELIMDFYKLQNGAEMSSRQLEITKELLEITSARKNDKKETEKQ